MERAYGKYLTAYAIARAGGAAGAAASLMEGASTLEDQLAVAVGVYHGMDGSESPATRISVEEWIAASLAAQAPDQKEPTS